ncbi:MAG: TerC family protein [Mycobacterium leprae]
MFEGITIGAVLSITFIDLVLSGDNAVVIGMAARSLPPKQQKLAIFWGGAAAIILRVLVTAVVAYALRVPLLQMAGGLLLVWIALKLMKGEEESKEVRSGNNTMQAITTIVMADFVMSLDNMLAVGGVSHGSIELLLFGLVISMAIIMFFSSVVAKLMNKYSWLVYVGSGILAWTAGDMIMHDRWLNQLYAFSSTITHVFSALLVVLVLLLGFRWNRKVAE